MTSAVGKAVQTSLSEQRRLGADEEQSYSSRCCSVPIKQDTQETNVK